MSVQQYRAQALVDSLPAIGECDYDIGPANGSSSTTGETAWLLGGNQQSQLVDGRIPYAGANRVYDLGINVEGSDGINIITDQVSRVRIMGADEACLDGKVLVSNGFIENRACAATAVFIPPGTVPSPVPGSTEVRIADVFLPRPANTYNLSLSDADGMYLIPFSEEFVPEEFVTLLTEAIMAANPAIEPTEVFTPSAFATLMAAPDASLAGTLRAALIDEANMSRLVFENTVYSILSLLRLNMLPGQYVLFINNIFLGDPSTPTPADIASYSANTRVDAQGKGTLLYNDMDIRSFDYLLKIENGSSRPVGIVFNTGDTMVLISNVPTSTTLATGAVIFSNANLGGAGSFSLPSGGGAFFSMRVEERLHHIMLSNVIYNQYVAV